MSEERVAYLGQRTAEATEIMPAAIDKLAEALSKAQGELKNPPKNKTVRVLMSAGGSYTYYYSDLADILDCVRETLAKHGLAVTQIVTRADGGNVLLTRLLHVSGQFLEGVYPLPLNAPLQDMGKAITYARRYSICPLLGIAGETDTDAQGVQDAAESAEEEKKRQALDRLEAAKAQGRVRSAYDGRTLKPGEAALPAEAPTKERGTRSAELGTLNRRGEPTPDPSKEGSREGERGVQGEAPGNVAGESAIDPRLERVLKRDGITIEQLKEFSVKGKYIPPDMDMGKLEENFILACLKPANWKKVVAFASAAGRAATAVKGDANAAKEGAK